MDPLGYLSQACFQGFKPGLERVQTLLDALGNPERALRFIHVAGTNGKGSVCACLASVLKEAGYRVGLYTSPFVVRWHERVQVNGAHITDAALAAAVETLAPIAARMEDTPTQFELETALAILHFAQAGCHTAVLEVGMGGSWDSTNVIPPPELAVLCAIGLDHCANLGGTTAQIAAVKAGILKPGCSAAAYPSGAEADAVVDARCRELGIPLARPDFSALRIRQADLEALRFDYGPYENLSLPLLGAYQPKNAALAVTALEQLRKRGYAISDEALRGGLAAVRWPGRYELLRKDPVFLLDGSHNPHGMAATAESLRLHFGNKKLVFLMGVMADKDVKGIVAPLAPLAASFVAVEPPNPRAMHPEALAALLREETGLAAEAFTDIEDGVRCAVRTAGPNGAVAALGSLYFSAQVREAVAKL